VPKIIIIIVIINFICQQKHLTDCNTTEYNMVKYIEQDREAQNCFYISILDFGTLKPDNSFRVLFDKIVSVCFI